MSKAEFKTHRYTDIDGEFVTPKIGSDPYMGLDFGLEGDFIDNLIGDLAQVMKVPHNSARFGFNDDTWLYQENHLKERYPELPIHREHVDLVINTNGMQVHKTGNLPEIYQMQSKLSKMKYAPSISRPSLRVMQECAYINNTKDEPTPPYLKILDIHKHRSFRWLEGKARISASGEPFGSVYGVTNAPIIVLASATIKFCEL